jgi:hypothetical protein
MNNIPHYSDFREFLFIICNLFSGLPKLGKKFVEIEFLVIHPPMMTGHEIEFRHLDGLIPNGLGFLFEVFKQIAFLDHLPVIEDLVFLKQLFELLGFEWFPTVSQVSNRFDENAVEGHPRIGDADE